MNSKKEKIYEETLLKIKYLISWNDKFPIKAKIIRTDYEFNIFLERWRSLKDYDEKKKSNILKNKISE